MEASLFEENLFWGFGPEGEKGFLCEKEQRMEHPRVLSLASLGRENNKKKQYDVLRRVYFTLLIMLIIN